jgi:hypothetical protein
MADMAIARKTMTIGEGGTALALVALATVSIFIAAKCLHAGIRVPRLSRRRGKRGGRVCHCQSLLRPSPPSCRPPARSRRAFYARNHMQKSLKSAGVEAL